MAASLRLNSGSGSDSERIVRFFCHHSAFAARVHTDRDVGVAVATFDTEPGAGGIFACRKCTLARQVLCRSQQLLQLVRQRAVDGGAQIAGDLGQRGRRQANRGAEFTACVDQALARKGQRIACALGLDQRHVGIEARVFTGRTAFGDRLRAALEQVQRALFQLHTLLRRQHGEEACRGFDAGLAAHVVDLGAQRVQPGRGGFAALRLLPAGFEGLADAHAPFVPGAGRPTGPAAYGFGAELGVVEQQRGGFAARAFGGGELRFAGEHGGVRGLGQAHRLVQGQRGRGGRGLGTRGGCDGGQRKGQRHDGESHRIILLASRQKATRGNAGWCQQGCGLNSTPPPKRTAAVSQAMSGRSGPEGVCDR